MEGQEQPDPEFDRRLNELYAGLSALRAFVVADITRRWTPDEVDRWHVDASALNDEVDSPDERGRAFFTMAIDRIGRECRAAFRRRSG